MKNEIEEINERVYGYGYIKNYPIINGVVGYGSENNLIHYLLHCEENDKEVMVNYKVFGELLNIKEQSVRNLVNKLRHQGLVDIKEKMVTVNMNNLIKEIIK